MRFLLSLILLLTPLMVKSEGVDLSDAYSIQVYASRTLKESQEFAQKFHSFGQPFVIPIKIQKEKWFRVYVGLYQSKEDAEEFKEKIKQSLNIQDAIVIKLINMD